MEIINHNERMAEYDRINTVAVKWLLFNRKTARKNLGIDNFDLKNSSDRWMFQTFFNYGILTNNIYFIKPRHFFIYLYYRVLKHHFNLKLARKKDEIYWIDTRIFVKETNSISDIPNITSEIYDTLYRS